MKVGDVVILKSGGSLMTVSNLTDYEAVLVWEKHDGTIASATTSPSALQVITASDILYDLPLSDSTSPVAATVEDVNDAAGTLWLHASSVYGQDAFFRATQALVAAANPGK